MSLSAPASGAAALIDRAGRALLSEDDRHDQSDSTNCTTLC
jgi:hypothetical protein